MFASSFDEFFSTGKEWRLLEAHEPSSMRKLNLRFFRGRGRISLLILSKLINLHSSWNNQNTYSFLMISEGIEFIPSSQLI